MTVLRAIGAVVGVLLLVVAGVAMYVLVSPESTHCYAAFETPADAETAVSAAGDAGFSDSDMDERGNRIAVTFTTGASGDDAAETRARFAAFIRERNGRLAHPDDGCLEKEALGG